MLSILLSLIIAVPPQGTYLGLRVYSLSTLPSYYSILFQMKLLRLGTGLEIGIDRTSGESWNPETQPYKVKDKSTITHISPSVDFFFLLGEKNLYKEKIIARFIAGLSPFYSYDKSTSEETSYSVNWQGDSIESTVKETNTESSIGITLRSGIEFQVKSRFFIQLRGDLMSMSHVTQKLRREEDGETVFHSKTILTRFRGINLFYSTFSTWVYIKL